ncbi:MAG: hypothetical protein DRO05_02550 [Thermoproteota archaeon]|nr:MAG: hypothetical protein DRO05_02550 [Candidatus Korarchaeota archaeon]
MKVYLETFSQIDKELGLLFYASDIPGLGGRIKERPEDFIVVENSIIEPDSSGNHLVLVIWKKDLSTREVVELIAKKLGIGKKAVGVAGMKDKRAVAIQKISIPYKDVDLRELEVEGHLKILGAFRAKRKVRVGYLRGNFFKIVVRGVKNLGALNEIIAQLRERGCPNYYGYQRFGGRTRNHELGRLIIEGNYDLLASRMGLRRRISGVKDVLRLDLRLLRFFINSYQSYLFNLMVSERMRRGHPINEFIDGDFVKGGKPAFPLIGYKSKLPREEAGDIVESVLEREGVGPEDFNLEIRKLRDKGGLRKVPMTYRLLKAGICSENDVILSFWLEKGCYATVLLREFCKWSEPPI